MTWTETDLRTLHTEHLAGASVNSLSARYARPNHNLVVAWARLGLFCRQNTRITRRNYLPEEYLRRLHAEWMAGESLMSIGRRTGVASKGLPSAFAFRGLSLELAATGLSFFRRLQPKRVAKVASFFRLPD